jgi:hypothetical protein
MDKETVMRIATFCSAVAVLMLGAITLAQNTTYDFDRATDFSRFRTYAWIPGTVAPDEINHTRIVNAVNAQLARKGLSQAANSANADLLVAYHATFGRNLRITGFSSGFGPYGFGPNRAGSAQTEQIVNGTLIVDIIDANTRTIVWRGTVSKEVDAKADPRKRERNINQAAERLFKNYPPAR